jgi:hypothetical protein
MPRTNAAGELLKKTTVLDLYRIASGTIGDTVTTAPVAATGAETTIAVSSATNFTSADPVFVIGDGGLELLKIGTPNATMPVTPPPKIAQSTGARMVEAVRVNIGKFLQDSVSWTGTKSLTAVFEEIGDTAVVYISGPLEFGISFGLLGYNGPNLQFATGFAESETGDGLAEATAYQSLVGGIGQAVQSEQVIRWQGLRHDAKKLQIDFLNAYVETNINAPLQKTAASSMQVTCKASQLIVRQFA